MWFQAICENQRRDGNVIMFVTNINMFSYCFFKYIQISNDVIMLQKDQETQEEPGRIAMYHHTRFSKKKGRWVSFAAEENYVIGFEIIALSNYI